jgi:hypothetical protein
MVHIEFHSYGRVPCPQSKKSKQKLFLNTSYYSFDHIKNYEMCGTCSTVRRDEMCLLGFSGVS